MRNRGCLLSIISLLFISMTLIGNTAISQTEGFNVKTPTQNIADSSTKFLKNIVLHSAQEPEKSVPQNLVCSSKCFIVIPEIDIVQSRGDFTGTGLMACRLPASDSFTQPLYYRINNLKNFDEGGGGILIIVSDTEGMKSVIGEDIHLSTQNSSSGIIGNNSGKANKSFLGYVKPKDQALMGFDLSVSVIEYASKDTFNAYQGTVIPIEIFVSPQDVPPVLRNFDSLLTKWIESCE